MSTSAASQRCLRQPGECVAGIFRSAHLVAFFVKPFAQRISHAEFVVHNQQLAPCVQVNHLDFVVPASRIPPPAHAPATVNGSVTVKAVPFPTSDWTSIRPP